MSLPEDRTARRALWIAASGFYVVLALLLRFLPSPTGPYLATWPLGQKVLVVLGIPLLPAGILLLCGYAFTKSLGVIPRNAWIIASLAYLGITSPMFFYVLPHDPQMGHWPRWGQALFVYGIFLIVFAYVALVGYVYGDAKRRGMRHVMWTLLAIFVPDAIGIILYFILRDPPPITCPGCQNAVLAKYTFCPSCGTSLRPYCPQCGKSAERGWVNCGYCGAPLPKS